VFHRFLGGCAIDPKGRIYIFGGTDRSASARSAMYYLEPGSNKWESGPKMPQPLCCFSSVYDKDQIVVIGGSTIIASMKPPFHNTVHCFSFANQKWTTNPNRLPTGVKECCAALLGGGSTLHVFGGCFDNRRQNSHYVVKPFKANHFNPVVSGLDAKENEALSAEAALAALATYTPPQVASYANGSFDVKYTIFDSGLYWIQVLMNGHPIAGSPFRVQVKSPLDVPAAPATAVADSKQPAAGPKGGVNFATYEFDQYYNVFQLTQEWRENAHFLAGKAAPKRVQMKCALESKQIAPFVKRHSPVIGLSRHMLDRFGLKAGDHVLVSSEMQDTFRAVEVVQHHDLKSQNDALVPVSLYNEMVFGAVEITKPEVNIFVNANSTTASTKRLDAVQVVRVEAADPAHGLTAAEVEEYLRNYKRPLSEGEPVYYMPRWKEIAAKYAKAQEKTNVAEPKAPAAPPGPPAMARAESIGFGGLFGDDDGDAPPPAPAARPAPPPPPPQPQPKPQPPAAPKPALSAEEQMIADAIAASLAMAPGAPAPAAAAAPAPAASAAAAPSPAKRRSTSVELRVTVLHPITDPSCLRV
jgi:hypothetical protein